MLRTALLVTGAAAALAACNHPMRHHRHDDESMPAAISRLDCPERQGALKRLSAVADGKTCVYADDAGGEVTLQLVDLQGQEPSVALSAMEAKLKAELPPRTEGYAQPAEAVGDDVNIDLPGLHIRADKNGAAHVQTPGVDVHADKSGAAHVDVRHPGEDGSGKGGVSVNADNGGAEIHVDEGWRHGVRQTLILASKTPGPNGYRLAGYEARGPRGGPLVVAEIKAKVDERDHAYEDMRALVARNTRG